MRPSRAAGRPATAAALGDQESRILAEFGAHYGFEFRSPELLKLALTHRSYLHVTGQGPRESNERLEFLGDSVLGLVTSEFLYRAHPTEHEGQLTKTKSLLVSKAILSRRALAMGLGRFVFMSHSEVESGGRQRLSILADAFEAVIGAIYLDQGFESARHFIERWLLRDSRVIVADKRHTNYKSHLQEYVQSTFRTHPVYRIRSEMGPDHSKQFMVEVMVGRRILGEGKGRNKKEAEQAAARNALEEVETGPVSDRDRRAERGAERGTERGTERERPRRSAVPPAEERAAAPPSRVLSEAGTLEEEDETREEGSPRRRRGRRGGRGRHRGEGAVGEASSPATPAQPQRRPAPAPDPMRSPRPDDAPAGAPVARRKWFAEDEEDEEVGRPEGPDDRAVDPYGWERGPAAEESEPEAEVSEALPEPRPREGVRFRDDTLEDEIVEPEAFEGQAEAVEPEAEPWSPEEEGSPKDPAPTAWGRRPGRPGRSRRSR